MFFLLLETIKRSSYQGIILLVLGNRISTEEVKLTDSGLNIECVAENSLGRVSSVTLLDISTSKSVSKE